MFEPTANIQDDRWNYHLRRQRRGWMFQSVFVCESPKKYTHLHTCQCFTWSCKENSISREQPADPEHQQLYIRHIICIKTTSVQQLHRGMYSRSYFTHFRLFHRAAGPWSLLSFLYIRFHAAPWHAPTLSCHLKMKRLSLHSSEYFQRHPWLAFHSNLTPRRSAVPWVCSTGVPDTSPSDCWWSVVSRGRVSYFKGREETDLWKP